MFAGEAASGQAPHGAVARRRRAPGIGPARQTRCRFALDCAATTTLVVPSILDALGYSPLTGEETSSVVSAVAIETGYLRRVARFHALGFQHENFQVNASDLHEDAGIDGLLGLNFLH